MECGSRATHLPFTSPWLLAPMEGVTEPCYRGEVLALHNPAHLGGACTEFLRVVDHGFDSAHVARHIGASSSRIPVGVQLMGSHIEAIATTAASVTETNAAFLDLNFGCPTRGALKTCAGAALLREPERIEELVGVCVEATAGQLPVSAKIRAGFEDASQLEEIALSAQEGGASLLTVHCRTRAEGYTPEVDWTRIARAVDALDIPVCGNGGVRRFEDLQRMRDETGCAYVMVGHAALANPWVFSGEEVRRAQAVGFLNRYSQSLAAAGAQPRKRAARLKQLIRVWNAGEFVAEESERRSWMAEPNPAQTIERLERLATHSLLEQDHAIQQ